MEVQRDREKVKKALHFLKKDRDRTFQEQLELCQIPAPSGMEEKRAEYMYRKMLDAGLSDVRIDEVGNVLGVLQGAGTGPSVMLAAHTDTVFSMETDLSIQRDGERYYCPGINDDTRALAELLTIARAFQYADLCPDGDVIFCANVCEEGLGDLKGVRHLFKDQSLCDYFISIDDPRPGGIIYQAIGSIRYRVRFHGPGGHSFTAFGTPNPIHAMGRAISAISGIHVPDHPKTTFNVGVIEGGTSVNTISEDCSMLVDLRSESESELLHLAEQVRGFIDQAADEEKLRWKEKNPGNADVTAEIEEIGHRPAGTQNADLDLVVWAMEACRETGIEPELLPAASTDANIPISLGIPAITIGQGGCGGGTHTLKEWYDPKNSELGPQRDLLLLLKITELK